MGSASPPDPSPTRVDQSETISADQGAQSITLDNGNDRSDSSDAVIRKGRGTFRAGSDTQQDQKLTRPPRARDIDPTAQRQYPKSNDKSMKQGHRKSKSESRRGSNGILQPASESGDSATEAIPIDDVSKLSAAFENVSFNEKDNNSPLAQGSAAAAAIQTQNFEEWERNVDGGERVMTPTSPDSEARRLDGQRNDGGNYNNGGGGNNNTNKPQFKKGHKKSKSSRIEFNFDPDAYEGSTRILDVFGFPSTFKTHNLHEIFHEYENMRGGYRIKWMDDTRALIIFEHPATARKAYLDNVANPLASVKPYDGPTDFLQKNANNNTNNATPPRARPQTTDMVARRLVHGALGVRGPRSPEQRQAERQLLQNARDQRDQKRAEEVRRAQELEAAFNE